MGIATGVPINVAISVLSNISESEHQTFAFQKKSFV